MLLILTGDVEIGKTTWLTKAADALTAAGVRCDGVLAPGVWQQCVDGSLDKLGIDNLLLPSREKIPFARRADLAQAEGAFDESAQSAKAQLKWHISDRAIARVNAHFDALMEENGCLAEDMCDAGAQAAMPSVKEREIAPAPAPASAGATPSSDLGGNPDHSLRFRPPSCRQSEPEQRPGQRQRVLIVDELGQLELLRGEGLTSAVRILEKGPCGIYAHAILIARDRFGLVDAAEQRFAAAWGESTRIAPTDDAWERWIAPLLP